MGGTGNYVRAVEPRRDYGRGREETVRGGLRWRSSLLAWMMLHTCQGWLPGYPRMPAFRDGAGKEGGLRDGRLTRPDRHEMAGQDLPIAGALFRHQTA